MNVELMSLTAAIGIICKTPIPGASKTRMIRWFGAEGAAALAGCFLRDIAAAIEAVPCAVGRRGFAVYAPEGTEASLRTLLPDHFGLVCRRDATLGVVLLGATEHLLSAGHDCVVLVNADSPTLPPLLLEQAIAEIRRPGARVVLGPAIDGGYYLIALKQAYASLFEAVPWSTPDVFAATVARAADIRLPVVTLPEWYDVDDAQSMLLLLAEMRGEEPSFETKGLTGGHAPATRAFLSRHPEIAERLSVPIYDCRSQ